MSMLVYGPPGCGKTKYAEFLAKRYGCRNVIDDAKLPTTAKQGRAFLDGDDLWLVTTVDWNFPKNPYVPAQNAIPFDEAVI